MAREELYNAGLHDSQLSKLPLAILHCLHTTVAEINKVVRLYHMRVFLQGFIQLLREQGLEKVIHIQARIRPRRRLCKVH